MEFDPHAQQGKTCPYCGFNQDEGEHVLREFRDMADGTVEEIICKPVVCVHHPLSHTRLITDPPYTNRAVSPFFTEGDGAEFLDR